MPNLSDLAQTPSPKMLGRGLAQMAGTKLSMRKPYRDYVISATESGEEILPYDEWVKKQDNG